MSRSAAIFDFDGTLVKGDSLLPFVVGVAGWPKALLTLALSILSPALIAKDRKTEIKKRWLKANLDGRSLDEVRKVAAGLKEWRRWKVDVKSALEKHKAEGAKVVIATGALDLYIHEVAEGLPVDAVMCTEMERVGGKLTGRLLGENCVRKEKARRVAKWLAENGPFETTYGYGNAPSDLPFLALVDKARII